MSNSNHHIISQEQLDQLGKAWSRFIDCIAHDLKSPLGAVRAYSYGLEKTFPSLVKAYHLAVENKLMEPVKDEKILKLHEIQLIPGLNQAINDMVNFLSLLHPYDRKLISDSQDIQSFSIKSCIDNLLTKFPFSNDDARKLIHVDCKNDFQFRCAAIFIESLLNNLLENALEAIQQAKKGEITIWTSKEGDCNILHFKDTALGMDTDKLEKIFNGFFSKRNDKIVPGLGFCRLAIMQGDGEVLCESVNGEYTEFLIKFPK